MPVGKINVILIPVKRVFNDWVLDRSPTNLTFPSCDSLGDGQACPKDILPMSLIPGFYVLMFSVSGIHYKAPSSSITKLPNDCWERVPPKILVWYTFVLNWVPLNVVFHLRWVIWTIACSQRDPSITFSIVSYTGILCLVPNAFSHVS